MNSLCSCSPWFQWIMNIQVRKKNAIAIIFHSTKTKPKLFGQMRIIFIFDQLGYKQFSHGIGINSMNYCWPNCRWEPKMVRNFSDPTYINIECQCVLWNCILQWNWSEKETLSAAFFYVVFIRMHLTVNERMNKKKSIFSMAFFWQAYKTLCTPIGITSASHKE